MNALRHWLSFDCIYFFYIGAADQFLAVGQRNFSIFNINYSLFNSEALWASRLHSPLCLPTSTCSLVFALCCVKTIEQGKGEFVL